MDATTISFCALGVTILMSLLGIGEKLFGGGNLLANKFAKLKEENTKVKEDVAAQIATVRNDHQTKLDEYATNTRVGIDQIRTNIHLLEKAILESRLELAQQYMRRDSFYKATDELKRDFKDDNKEVKSEMHAGFERIEKQLDAMSQAIEAARKHQK